MCLWIRVDLKLCNSDNTIVAGSPIPSDTSCRWDLKVGAELSITVWPTVLRGSSHGHASVTKGKYTALSLNLMLG